MMKKKLFIFDIDRTIKPYFSDIPEPTRKAIALLKEKHTICLATGRCYNESKAIVDKLGLQYLVCNGGSDVYINHQLVFQDAPDFKDELESLKMHLPIHFFVCDNGVYSYRFPSYLKCIGWFKRFYPKTSSIYGLIAMMGDVKEAASSQEMGTVHKFYVFGKYEGKLDYKRMGNKIHTYEFENKALGVNFLIDHLGGFDEIISFGDSRNDLALFDISTRAYANEKGNELLKAKATDLFNIKDGIYKIVLKELAND